jgi:hypothetical protein
VRPSKAQNKNNNQETSPATPSHFRANTAPTSKTNKKARSRSGCTKGEESISKDAKSKNNSFSTAFLLAVA